MHIWWLNQVQCEAIVDEDLEVLPQYLQDEFDSRYGRPGRGRLWVSKELEEAGKTLEVNPWPDTELALELGGHKHPSLSAGGIVIKDEHLPLVLTLPGTITDMKLNKIGVTPSEIL